VSDYYRDVAPTACRCDRCRRLARKRRQAANLAALLCGGRANQRNVFVAALMPNQTDGLTEARELLDDRRGEIAALEATPCPAAAEVAAHPVGVAP
jgi:hypothetical protein